MPNPRTWNPERPELDLDERTRDLLKAFRRHLLARGLAVGTIRMRVDTIANLAASCGDLTQITLEQLEDQLARRRRTHSAESRKSTRSAWRVFYAWMVRTGQMEEDPTKLLQPVYVPQKTGRIASDEMVVNALKLATLPEKAMILLARYAGLRLSELTNLHMRDREGDQLRIVGKGGKQRLVPINPELLQILERLEVMRGSDDYYFPGLFGGAMHPQSVEKIIKRRLGMNPHSLRHAAATAAYRGTGDLRSVQEMLGHASLATTQRYLHVDPEGIRAAAAATSLNLSADVTGSSAIERTRATTRGGLAR